MADYPVLDGNGAVIIGTATDPAWSLPARHDYASDYPVLDGNGAVIIATPFEGSVPVVTDSIVVFGDSTAGSTGASTSARHWRNILANDVYGGPWNVAWNGDGGETSTQELARVDADETHRYWPTISMDRPNTGEPSTTWLANQKAIIAKQLSSFKLIMPPLQDVPNTSIANIAEGQAGLLSDPDFADYTLDADMQAAYITALSAANTRSDGTHLNDRGQAIQAFFISAHMRKKGFRSQQPAAADFIARISSAPTDTRAAYYNSLIERVKGCGAWDALDYLRVWAAHTEQAGSLNLVSTDHLAVKVGTATHVTDEGFYGDGSTGYWLSGFNPGDGGSYKFQQNDAHLMVFPTENKAENKDDFGAPGTMLRSRQTDGAVPGRINQSGSSTLATGQSNSARPLILCRTGATTIEAYIDATGPLSYSSTSQAVSDNELREGSGGYLGFATKRQGAFSAGSKLAEDVAEQYSLALIAWMRAVGNNI